MRIAELLQRIRDAEDIGLVGIEPASGGSDPTAEHVEHIEYDSRRISKNSPAVFACARGDHTDGHLYAESAVANGAVALICDRRLPLDITQILVHDVRSAMSSIAAELYRRPALKMTMIGLTGTNGKTTTAYMTRSIMRESGAVAGMLGTIVYDDGRCEEFADRTTPEGPDIQKFLSRMVENGASCCVMEASSHGIDQGRLKGCLFDRVGFGNLTMEHLEYHKDMESYFSAKRALFTDYVKEKWLGIANADDEYARRLLADFPGISPYGFYRREKGGYGVRILENKLDGIVLEVIFPDEAVFEIRSPLIGSYNAMNILESVAVADSLDIDRETIVKGVENAPQIPGRLERYSLSNGVTAFIDYAHSSDGMEKILTTIRPLAQGKLIVAWGAGGDRSKDKRGVVGAKMAEYSDIAIVTTDNPRSEEPKDIANDVMQGVLSSGFAVEHRTILDRREAIYDALDSAESGDVVVIAGKGPERTIEYADRHVPFCDCGTLIEWASDRSVGVL